MILWSWASLNNDDETAYLDEGGETYNMVPGTNCLSLNVSKTQRADRGLQEETAAALHSSYDQWDPCGRVSSFKYLGVNNLRGPDMDYTHSNSG